MGVRMEFYDPQTLGIMVFGGFMLVSALGLFLVSTFSMKETSYEEALAKQRKELEKASQHKGEKKKKGKAKKRDDKANGRLLEPDQDQSASVGSTDASPEVASEVEPTALVELPVSPLEKEKPAVSPLDKKKKEKKGAKAEQGPGLAPAALPTAVSQAPVAEVTPEEGAGGAAPPAEAQQKAPLTNSVTLKKSEVPRNQEELKQEVAAKKKPVAKKKRETMTVDADAVLCLPYEDLACTIQGRAFGKGEAQQLMEILAEKAGAPQDVWHMATQKSDPVAVLKRQLEEKEKQLATEQENATAAKTKLRELSKEVAAEKAKTLLAENKRKERLAAHEQEVAALQARMQASYRDHVAETQQLQGKIRTLQEQLEKGPNTQVARLQQENSILRDALNQATSQTESKQNAELAKLRQECSKLGKELSENLELLRQAEEQKAALEARAAASEEQLYQLQLSQKEQESPLQKRVEELCADLCKSEVSCRNLQAELDEMKEQPPPPPPDLPELQSQLLSSKAELKKKQEEVDALRAKLSEAAAESAQFSETVQRMASQARKAAEEDQEASNPTEKSLLQLRLQESLTQVSVLEKEVAELNNTVEQLKLENNDLRETNREVMEAVVAGEEAAGDKLLASDREKQALEEQLGAVQAQAKQVLMSLFPQVMTDEQQQAYDEWLQQFQEKAVEAQQQKSTAPASALELSFTESEEARRALQAECDQYRTILAETERMLKDLQKSVEEEEQVWKTKLRASEEALTKSQNQMKCLEEEVEKLKEELQSTNKLKEYAALLEAQLENHLVTANSESQTYTKKVEELGQLLSESEEQLDAAKAEALRQSQGFAQARGSTPGRVRGKRLAFGIWTFGLGLHEDRVKIGGRNINSLRYADDPTLLAENSNKMATSEV